MQHDIIATSEKTENMAQALERVGEPRAMANCSSGRDGCIMESGQVAEHGGDIHEAYEIRGDVYSKCTLAEAWRVAKSSIHL
jgi:hypothetical protein